MKATLKAHIAPKVHGGYIGRRVLKASRSAVPTGRANLPRKAVNATAMVMKQSCARKPHLSTAKVNQSARRSQTYEHLASLEPELCFGCDLGH